VPPYCTHSYKYIGEHSPGRWFNDCMSHIRFSYHTHSLFILSCVHNSPKSSIYYKLTLLLGWWQFHEQVYSAHHRFAHMVVDPSEYNAAIVTLLAGHLFFTLSMDHWSYSMSRKTTVICSIVKKSSNRKVAKIIIQMSPFDY